MEKAKMTIPKENKMGTMPIGRLLMSMSTPMMISMLVQAFYNVVDSVFVSRLGENALNAVSLAFPLQSLMIAIAAGTGVGVNALMSRALGEKNQDKVDTVATNGIFIYALSYLVVAIIGFVAVKPFYRFQTGSGDNRILTYGVTY